MEHRAIVVPLLLLVQMPLLASTPAVPQAPQASLAGKIDAIAAAGLAKPGGVGLSIAVAHVNDQMIGMAQPGAAGGILSTARDLVCSQMALSSGKFAGAAASPRTCSTIAAMTLSRDAAWAQLCAWTKTDSLRNHACAVEIVMRAAAGRYGGPRADPAAWGLAGLLHDADYEAWPDEHPRRIVAWLRECGEDALAAAIASHYTKWGPATTPMARALLACDELTGFVVACTMVRPEGIATLEARSVLKRLKDKSFAAKVERSEIQAGAEGLGVDLAAHVQFVIDALRPSAAGLGLLGRTEG